MVSQRYKLEEKQHQKRIKINTILSFIGITSLIMGILALTSLGYKINYLI